MSALKKLWGCGKIVSNFGIFPIKELTDITEFLTEIYTKNL